MNRQLGMVLLLSLVSAGSAYAAGAGDRAGSRLDLSRSRSEARYGTTGNEPETERKYIPPEYTTDRGTSGAGQGPNFIAADRVRSKPKRVLVPGTGTYTTVTKPAPVRVNPY